GNVVRHSDSVTGGPGAIMLRDTTASMSADDPLRPIFEHTATLGTKDLSLALQLAAAQGLDLPLAAIAVGRLTSALGVGESQLPTPENEEQ
ncbi:MAG: NAD(P)-dependent oxidoreductase, partial [Acidimicrobiia bacterium]